jgi:hypothetical protein
LKQGYALFLRSRLPESSKGSEISHNDKDTYFSNLSTGGKGKAGFSLPEGEKNNSGQEITGKSWPE